MATKIIGAIVIVILLSAGLLFIDRPFVRFAVTAAPSDDSGPWVQVQNQGAWDATAFVFGCTVVEARDAAGAVVIPRRRGASFLAAWGGDLSVNESRRYSCALPSEVKEKIAEAEMAGFAFFSVRYLPLSRARHYRILLKRGGDQKLQIISIHQD